MSAVVASLRCVRCKGDFPDDRALTRHLVDDELISASEALPMVRKAREIAEVRADPYGLDRNEITKHQEPADGAEKEEPVAKGQLECTRCDAKFSRINGLSRHLSQSHGVKKDAKAPAATGGGGSSKRSAPKPEPTVAREASQNGLVAHIEQLRADVARGKAAEAELADVKKALAGT